MIKRKVVVELPVVNPLNYFGYDGEEGDGHEIRWFRGIAGLEDRMDKGMFPRIRNVRLSETGIDDVKDECHHPSRHQFLKEWASAIPGGET